MPSLILNNQVIELDKMNHFIFWYRYIESITDACSIYDPFPPQDYYYDNNYKISFQFFKQDIEQLDDSVLNEIGKNIEKMIDLLQSEHKKMVITVMSKLGLEIPKSSKEKKQIEIIWGKLISGNCDTAFEKSASETLFSYFNIVKEIGTQLQSEKIDFQERIIKLQPKIAKVVNY